MNISYIDILKMRKYMENFHQYFIVIVKSLYFPSFKYLILFLNVINYLFLLYTLHNNKKIFIFIFIYKVQSYLRET